MNLLVLILGFYLLWLIWNKYGWFNPGFMHAAYCYGCMLLIYSIHILGLSKDDLHFTAMPMPFFGDVIAETLWIYLFIIIMCMASLWGLKKSSCTNKPDELRNIIAELERVLTQVLSSNFFVVGVMFAAVIVTIADVIHYLSVDLEFLYSNTYYLLIKDPDMMGLDSALGRLYHFLLRYLGLGFVFLAAYYLCLRNFLVVAYVFFPSMYAFMYLMAGNSRWAALYIVVALLAFAINRKPVLVVFASLCIIAVMLKVLIGRTLPYHGLNHLFYFMDYFSLQDIPMYLIGLLVNVFEGAMNLANTLLHNPDFVWEYKLKSFSPMFSFMDGFAQIRDSYKFKWAAHVPMSSISESYQFGWWFFAAWLGLLFSVTRKINRRLIQGGVMGVILFLPFIYILLGVHTYSVRTFFKLVLFLWLILWLLEKRQWSRLSQS